MFLCSCRNRRRSDFLVALVALLYVVVFVKGSLNILDIKWCYHVGSSIVLDLLNAFDLRRLAS